MNNDIDIFNLSLDDIIQESQQTSLIYHPNAKDGKNNIYTASIKFLPNLRDISKTIVWKWTVWLTNPSTGQKRLIDCPSTIKGQQSILQETFLKLYGSESVADKKLAEGFKRKKLYYSLIEIIQDIQVPDNDGLIKVFQYGMKIYNQIQGLVKPISTLDIEPNNPFDLFEGKPFMLNVTLNDKFNNYDTSKFLDKKFPFSIPQFDDSGRILRKPDGKIIRKGLEKTAENAKIIKDYLLEKSPDLSEYEYKPWDNETLEFVIEAIRSTNIPGKMLEGIFKKFKVINNPSTVYTSEIDNSIKKSSPNLKIDLNVDDDDIDISNEVDEMDEIDKIIQNTQPSPLTKKKNTPNKKQTTEVLDEIDDDFDFDLDDVE